MTKSSSSFSVVGTTGSTPTTDTSEATRLDDVGGGVTYVGKAVAGTLTSVASWKIEKIVQTGADIAITWADGNTNYDNIWDDRLSLSYS